MVSGFRAISDPFQPLADGGEGRNPLQLATQELLHGLPPARRTRGKLIAHLLGNVSNGDLD